jgi:hypothetical protein
MTDAPAPLPFKDRVGHAVDCPLRDKDGTEIAGKVLRILECACVLGDEKAIGNCGYCGSPLNCSPFRLAVGIEDVRLCRKCGMSYRPTVADILAKRDAPAFAEFEKRKAKAKARKRDR